MGTGQALIEFAGAGESVAPVAAAPAPAAKAEPEAVVVEGNGEVMKAPMGGTVLEFKVKPGDTVKKGDVVLVYEAMKMENNLTSDREGTIAALLIEEGEVMATDQPIIEFGAVKGGAKPAPAPAAKPAPAPAAKQAAAPAPKAEVKSVNPVDINKALSPVEGGTAAKSVLPTGRKENTPTLKLGEGTTLEINVSPDGGISIRITTGK
ncbi:MAG: biotin/lipoyl-containing protein [Lepagella sp.]